MQYWHTMTWRTEGVRVCKPVRWRCLDGIASVYWQAESQAGATGYYLSPDPWLMVFLDDVSSRVRISNRNGEFLSHHRPMARAIFVPAGVPMWATTSAKHQFSHLNLHMHKDRLLRFLQPSVGSSMALSAIRSPVELQSVGAIETLAGLLIDEVSSPSRHAVYAESLVGSIVTGLLDIPDTSEQQSNARLTRAQMNKLSDHLEALGDYRLTVSDMAASVGLSESWFTTVFKQTTGKTPLQWQLAKRVELAKELLLEGDMPVADVAAHLGFSDQSHFTKSFRQIAGDTPASWRRLQQRR